MIEATLRLFTSVQIETDQIDQPHSASTVERGVRGGYILDPLIPATDAVLHQIERIVGIDGEKANASFHKSWAIIKESTTEQLVVQQITHYLTTYWFEAIGIYNQATVYIPQEKLEVPEPTGDIALIAVKGLTAEQILNEVIKLGSGIALAAQTIDDIMTIVRSNEYAQSFVASISNRELSVRLNEHYGITPTEPVEFLRHVINALTGETLLIKNTTLVSKIKKSDPKTLDKLLENAPDDLASIFYRYKPLFLALKAVSTNKTFFNRLRKQAPAMHRPANVDYLNDVTNQIKNNQLDLEDLTRHLDSASIFRKIRLAYALKYRLHSETSIVYRVRNGRGWATEFNWPETVKGEVQDALDVVLNAIQQDLAKTLTGKVVYIPSHIHYALPATEKQFTGFFPTGSYVTIPSDILVGVHWTNTDRRIDLDLSAVSLTQKIGWDAQYRSDDNKVLFSGDITDAPGPRGASELFYFNEVAEPQLLMLNYFNHQPESPVPTKVFVGSTKLSSLSKNYVIDPSHIITSTLFSVEQRQMALGFLVTIDGENRFYFANMGLGTSISAGYGTHKVNHGLSYLTARSLHSLDFREILQGAGSTVVAERPDAENPETEYIDLSPETLHKATIVDLLQGQPEN